MNKTFKYIVLLALACFVGKANAQELKTEVFSLLNLDYAEKILKSLSGDAYLAKVGESQGFILMHSTGSLPNGSEIDTPLNYADYYYMEALKRFMDLKGISYKNL